MKKSIHCSEPIIILCIFFIVLFREPFAGHFCLCTCSLGFHSLQLAVYFALLLSNKLESCLHPDETTELIELRSFMMVLDSHWDASEQQRLHNKSCRAIIGFAEYLFRIKRINLWSILQPTTRGQLKRFHQHIQTITGMLGGTVVQLQA